MGGRWKGGRTLLLCHNIGKTCTACGTCYVGIAFDVDYTECVSSGDKPILFLLFAQIRSNVCAPPKINCKHAYIMRCYKIQACDKETNERGRQNIHCSILCINAMFSTTEHSQLRGMSLTAVKFMSVQISQLLLWTYNDNLS